MEYNEKLYSEGLLLKHEINSKLQAFAEQIDSFLPKIDSEFDLEPKDCTSSLGLFSNQTKIFQSRKSLLEGLFQIEDYRTVYHIFISLIILFAISTTLEEVHDRGALPGHSTLINAFWAFHIVIGMWICLLLMYLFPFVLLSVLSVRNGWRYPIFLIFLIGYSSFGYYSVLLYELPLASALIVVVETMRVGMKMYSYIREGVCGNLKSYFYFFFAPTLIYRNSYPKSLNRKTSIIIWSLCDFLLSIYLAYLLVIKYLLPVTELLLTELTWFKLITAIFDAAVPAVACFLCGFYGLHSWLNAWAELLYFDDRYFYQDWWNAPSLLVFYSRWSVPITDFLQVYVYSDLRNILHFSDEFAAIIAIGIAALLQEVILSVALGVFFPVTFVGFFFYILTDYIIYRSSRDHSLHAQQGYASLRNNITMWSALLIGNGLIYVIYMLEWQVQNLNNHTSLVTKIFNTLQIT